MRLIATDMDGTLLSNDSDISRENAEAIRKAQEQGIDVIVATGRSYESAKAPLEEAGLSLPVICVNGADIRTGEGEQIYSVTIQPHVSRQAQLVLKNAEIFYEVYTSKGLFINNKEQAIAVVMDILKTTNPDVEEAELRKQAQERIVKEGVSYVENYDSILEDPEVVLYKMLAFSLDKSKLEQAIAQLQTIEQLTVSSSAQDNIEITAKEAQKGIALQWYAKRLGISLEDTMAIGDNFNDVSMLRGAGFGVAMGNAEPEIKQLSNWTTKSNSEHGVAHAIEYVMNKEQISK